MNKHVRPFFDLVYPKSVSGASSDSIIEILKENGASYVMTFKVLEKLGYPQDQIDQVIMSTPFWKGHNRTYEEMFFEFVELDDDVIEPD